ncbi:GNAT family N-acetyltransferase, partial [Streptomyces anulatus]
MSDLAIRPALPDDLAAVVAMLADDPLGAQRESPDDLTPYQEAFQRLADDPNQHVVVAGGEDRVVGTLDLSILPGLCRPGGTRAAIGCLAPHRGGSG